MQMTARTHTAGLAGMAGSSFWLVAIVMQYMLGTTQATGGPLWVVHELFGFLGLAGAAVAFLGLVWGGAFGGRLGSIAVGVTALGLACIVVGGLLGLVVKGEDSPIFLLFPLGGLLQALGAILLVIAAIAASRWEGWQRWMPLVYGLYYIFALVLPTLLGSTPDGPGMFAEVGWGVTWFLVGLAVYTAQHGTVGQPATALKVIS